MRNLLDNYFMQNPLRIAERTKLIVSLATALWNAQHNEPLNETALHLFLCDETRSDLTEEPSRRAHRHRHAHSGRTECSGSCRGR